MPKVLVNDSTLTAIADAIREKTDTTETMLPSEMAGLIELIGGLPDGITEMEYVTTTLSAGANVITNIPTSMANGDVNAAVIVKSKYSSHANSIWLLLASKTLACSVSLGPSGLIDYSGSCSASISDGICTLRSVGSSDAPYYWAPTTYYVLLWR